MLFDSIGKMIFGFHQDSLANKIHPNYVPYETSPYAKQELGIAQQLFNGRMFGAGDLEKNIFANQANYNANVQRNATDSGQALALGEQSMGQTNDALQNLQVQEKQNKYDLLGNLNAGYRAMTTEGDKVYQDKFQKYQIDTEQQAGLRNAAWQNIFGGLGDLSGGLMQAGQLASGQGGNTPTTSKPQGGSGGGMDMSQLLPLLGMVL